jgi:hypothetical protein
MNWLTFVAWVSLGLGIAGALLIALDLFKRPQHMWIMNIVWPVTSLYAGPLGVWAYFRLGRAAAMQPMHGQMNHHQHSGPQKPFWQQVLVATTHCGSGCTLGDMAAETMLVAVPFVLFGSRLLTSWTMDFIWAYVLGIVFQYFTIVPMRHLSMGQGILAAMRADTLSLTSWQAGMYGWMAVAIFLIFRHELEPTGPLFWFMMQIAMLWGFLTAYPVNWWLLRIGWKEKM